MICLQCCKKNRLFVAAIKQSKEIIDVLKRCKVTFHDSFETSGWMRIRRKQFCSLFPWIKKIPKFILDVAKLYSKESVLLRNFFVPSDIFEMFDSELASGDTQIGVWVALANHYNIHIELFSEYETSKEVVHSQQSIAPNIELNGVSGSHYSIPLLSIRVWQKFKSSSGGDVSWYASLLFDEHSNPFYFSIIGNNKKVKVQQYNPSFDEVWEYYQESGCMINGIVKCSDGLYVDEEVFDNVYYDGDFKGQYQDAFAFSQRKKKEHMKGLSVKELLQHCSVFQIFRLLLKAGKAQEFTDEVSPLFRIPNSIPLHRRDQQVLSNLNRLTNMYEDLIIGYCRFDPEERIWQISDVFDKTIDNLTNSYKGFVLTQTKMFTTEMLYIHNFKPIEVSLILATLFYDLFEEDGEDDFMLMAKQGFNSFLETEVKISLGFYLNIERQNTYMNLSDIYASVSDKQILIDMLFRYCIMYGPFCVKQNGKIVWKQFESIFTAYFLFNQSRIDNTASQLLMDAIEKDVDSWKNNIANIQITIDKKFWLDFIERLNINTEEWKEYNENTKDVKPIVPCYVKLKGDDGVATLLACDTKKGQWNVLFNDKTLTLKRNEFQILTHERVLPEEVVFLPKAYQCQTEFRRHLYERNKPIEMCVLPKEYKTGKAIHKISESGFYAIRVEGFNNKALKMRYGVHFKWSNSIWINSNNKTRPNELSLREPVIDRVYGSESGIILPGEYEVELREEVVFNQDGERVNVYNPLFFGASRPQQSRKVDPLLYAFFNKKDRYSISLFLQFLKLDIPNNQLYIWYYQAKDIVDKEQDDSQSVFGNVSVQISKKKIITLVTRWAWFDMQKYISNRVALLDILQRSKVVSKNPTWEDILDSDVYEQVFNIIYA